MLRQAVARSSSSCSTTMRRMMMMKQRSLPLLLSTTTTTSSSPTSMMMMSKSVGRHRCFASAATSRQKRALNKQQLDGATTSKAPPPPTKPASTGTTPPSSSPPSGGGDGGGGGASIAIPAVALLAGAVGAAYVMELLPFDSSPKKEEEKTPAPSTVAATKPTQPKKKTKKENVKVTESDSSSTAESSSDESTTAVEAVTTDAVEKEDSTSDTVTTTESEEEASTSSTGGGSGRVVQIALPEGSTQSTHTPAPVEHPVGGHKVLMKPSTTDDDGQQEPSVDLALQELQARLSQESSRALTEAHHELANLSSLDMSDLDELTMTQLKVRLVQMAKEIEERTKWEAVRLKEFLALKERETADEYLQMIKKQKQDFEALMERRLREQKIDLLKTSETALQEKEDALQSVVDHALKLQESQFVEEKAVFEQQTEEQISAKYDVLFNKQMSQEKAELSQRLDAKLKLMQELSKKISELELALKTSRDFESGSVQAHRMSAAALTLVDRLESSEPAYNQVTALKAAVEESNPVVKAALDSLPSSALVGTGVPTLQELQTRFEESAYPKSRQAAMVPNGQNGTVEGQLLGIVLSKLKYPPGPDDAAPEHDKDAAEYVLSRARRHVQLGELEQAVSQLDKLDGQAEFTASDWKEQAKERLAVDKALKLIRMECALANESMSNK